MAFKMNAVENADAHPFANSDSILQSEDHNEQGLNRDSPLYCHDYGSKNEVMTQGFGPRGD
jgi:hypothetical protein